MPLPIGIDLGTSVSAAAVIDDGGLRLLLDPRGEALLPTVVHFAPDGEISLGEEARIRAPSAPQRTVYDFVPLLGRPFAGRTSLRAHAVLPMALAEMKGGAIGVSIGEAVHPLTGIAAMILGALAGRGSAVDATIAVPVGAGAGRRRAIMAAARRAGLESIRLVSAPLAIAAGWAFDHAAPSVVAIADLGASGCELALARVGGGAVEILASRSLPELGGRSVDLRIASRLAEQCMLRSGVDPRNDPAAVESLRSHAEWAKAELSSRDIVGVDVPRLLIADGGPVDLRGRLDRMTLDEFTAETVAALTEGCASLYAEMGLGRVDALLIAGGFGRCRPIRAAVESAFGRAASVDVDPETAVVAGAARIAVDGETIHLDICGAPVRVGRQTPQVVVPAGTPIPVRQGRLCGGDRAPVRIWQGLGDDLDDLVGELRVERPARVVVDVDRDGLLDVRLESLPTGPLPSGVRP